MTAETGSAQRRSYKILLHLAGHEFDGLANADIAKSLSENPATVLRDLQVMQDVGLAEQIEQTGRWRLGPKLVQIALRFQVQMGRAEDRLNETRRRFQAGSGA